MLKKLLTRTRPTPVATEVAPPAPSGAPALPDASPAEAVIDDWESKWETAHELIEGNGGHTDWALWTEMVKVEENAFAPTVPLGDSALAPLIPDEDFHVTTVPMPIQDR